MPESCLNCQHLPNPKPLRMVRKMVASGPPQPFMITVDNSEAREEIINFLTAQGYSVSGQLQDGVWHLQATPKQGQGGVSSMRALRAAQGGAARSELDMAAVPSGKVALPPTGVDAVPPRPRDDATPLVDHTENSALLRGERRRTMVMLSSDKMGHGDDALGTTLMQSFVASLGEFGTNLWRIVLMNSAVRLATYNSPVLRYLQEYEKNGSKVLVCQECAYHYDLKRNLGVGKMFDISELVTIMQMADRVLRF